MRHLKWNKDQKDYRTKMNAFKVRDFRKFVDKIDNDLDKEKRVEIQVCKVCRYDESKMALQAFMNANCGFCEVDMMFPSSNIDILCQRCAVMNDACKHCGGEMD